MERSLAELPPASDMDLNPDGPGIHACTPVVPGSGAGHSTKAPSLSQSERSLAAQGAATIQHYLLQIEAGKEKLKAMEQICEQQILNSEAKCQALERAQEDERAHILALEAENDQLQKAMRNLEQTALQNKERALEHEHARVSALEAEKDELQRALRATEQTALQNENRIKELELEGLQHQAAGHEWQAGQHGLQEQIQTLQQEVSQCRQQQTASDRQMQAEIQLLKNYEQGRLSALRSQTQSGALNLIRRSLTRFIVVSTMIAAVRTWRSAAQNDAFARTLTTMQQATDAAVKTAMETQRRELEDQKAASWQQQSELELMREKLKEQEVELHQRAKQCVNQEERLRRLEHPEAVTSW